MSNRLLRLHLVMTVVMSTVIVPFAPDSTEASIAPAPLTLTDVPAHIEPMVDWAIDLFDAAALELPPLHVVHHGSDTEPCHGRAGAHRRDDAASVIHLCTEEPSFPTQLMVLHEISHAWAEHFLTPEREAEFRALRGYDHWRDYEAADWYENGTEQAAEILVWGLSDRPLAMVRITQNSCGELDAGYRVLTGAAPLHGFTDYC